MQALAAPKPPLRVVKLETSDPTVLPAEPPPTVAPGTVTVIDCQDSWLDLRAWPQGPPTHATIVTMRCRLLMGDGNPLTWQTWTFNSSTHFPCNVRPLCNHAELLGQTPR